MKSVVLISNYTYESVTVLIKGIYLADLDAQK